MSQIYDLDPKRRALYLRILDGYHQNVHAITYRLHFLDTHFPPPKLDAALKWLIQNGHTGRRFLVWFAEACGNSDLEMHRNLLQVVDNAPLAHVVAGKNFKL